MSAGFRDDNEKLVAAKKKGDIDREHGLSPICICMFNIVQTGTR